jgi:hypothetical protein
VFADKEVGGAIDAFADTINNAKDIDGVAVRNASMNLGRLCRESLATAWKTPLEFPERTTKEQGAPAYNQLSDPGSATDHGSEQ